MYINTYTLNFHNVICHIYQLKKVCIEDQNNIMRNYFSPSLSFFYYIGNVHFFVGSHKLITMDQESALLTWPSLGCRVHPCI